MRRTLEVSGALPLIAMLAVGCGRNYGDVETAMDTGTESEAAMVRVVHAAPGLETVDVNAGDVTFSGVDFKTVTPYRPIAEFRPEFKVLAAGQQGGEPLAENAEMVLDGEYYTVIAMPGGEDGSPVKLTALRDEEAPSDSAKARIRVVNAAEGVDDLTITIESAHGMAVTDSLAPRDSLDTPAAEDNDNGHDVPKIEGLGFEDTASEEVEPGSATLVVRSGDGGQELLRVSDLRLEAGQSMTVVLVNSTRGSSQIEAVKVADERPTRGRAGG